MANTNILMRRACLLTIKGCQKEPDRRRASLRSFQMSSSHGRRARTRWDFRAPLWRASGRVDKLRARYLSASSWVVASAPAAAGPGPSPPCYPCRALWCRAVKEAPEILRARGMIDTRCDTGWEADLAVNGEPEVQGYAAVGLARYAGPPSSATRTIPCFCRPPRIAGLRTSGAGSGRGRGRRPDCRCKAGCA